MRKLLLSLTVLLLVNSMTNAQAPAFFNYQGVARNSVGNALVNKTIKLRLSIHDGSALGPIVYSETRSVITNAFGLFNVQVGGAGAINVTGSIAAASWNVGTKWMQVEIDPEGGNTLKDIGTTQLTSVPYSLFTTQSGDIVLPFVKSQNEESPLFKLTNPGNNSNSLAFEGLSGSTNNNATAVRGIITSIAPGVFSAGVVGQNNGTGANGVGIYGTQNGTGYGVYGTTPGGVGVFGNSTSGMGVYGQSVTGPSVMGYQPNTGTSNAGYFQNFSTTNTAATLRVQSNGIGEGLGVNVTGLGKAGILGINNAASGNTVFEASTNGLGKVAVLQNTGSSNSATVLDVSTNGLNRAAQFQNTNTGNTTPNVSSLSNGAGDGLQSMMTGTGKAGVFNINNVANNNTVLDVSTNGLGRTGYFQNTGAANTSNVMEVNSNGMGKVGVLQNTNAANTSNVLDVSTNGPGRTGFFQNTNAANTSSIFEVTSNGLGHTSRFANTNTANTNSALFGTSNGSGSTMDIKNTGTGRAATFEIANGSNAAAAVLATTNGTNSSGYFVNTNAANATANLASLSNGNGDAIQSINTGLGKAASFSVNNAANSANAMEVNTTGTGYAANITSTNAVPKALRTSGAITFTGISEAAGKVLATVDGSGAATWQSAASVGIVSGSGTTDYVPKWTPNGTAIGNSVIYNSGANVGVGTTIANSKLTVSGDISVTANSANYVGLFENTNGADGDGIRIKLGKTHPLWNGSSYKQVDFNAMIAPFQPQINTVQGWVTSGHNVTTSDIIDLVESNAALLAGTLCQVTNFLTDQLNTRLGLPYNIAGPINSALGLPNNMSGTLNTALGLPMDFAAPINDALNLPFDLADTINTAIGLPVRFSFLWLINEACDICVDDDDVAGSYFDLVPKIPSLEIPAIPNTSMTIPAIPNTFTIPAIPTLVIPAIPQINCSGLPTLQIPTLDLNNVNNTLTKNNNYLFFADKDDRQVGAIRAQSIDDWETSYLSPTYFLGVAGSMAGLDLTSAFGKAASALITMAGAYNKIGVEYVSGNGDYAEWLERKDIDEAITEGDIVGVKGGKISKDLQGAEQIMAVSYKPIVLGNMPQKGTEMKGNMVAFMGQIPVKVMGPVQAGDYIVAKGEFPGMGTAVHPDAMSVEDYKLAVGRSWETKKTQGAKMVNTVVGVHNNGFLKFVADLQEKAKTTDDRLKAIEEKLSMTSENSSPVNGGNQPKKGFK